MEVSKTMPDKFKFPTMTVEDLLYLSFDLQILMTDVDEEINARADEFSKLKGVYE